MSTTKPNMQLAIDFEARHRTRATDPDTSRAAASRAVLKLRDAHWAVMALFRRYGPMSDETMVERAGNAAHTDPRLLQSPSGLRTRRKELVTCGQLMLVRKERNANNMPCNVWDILK